MKVSFSHSGDFKKTEAFLRSLQKLPIETLVEPQAKKGVAALSRATPVDSSQAALSWNYKIEKTASAVTITWTNSNVENGFPVVIMLQYGHGTGTGGYVQGRDFINPAISPIFDEIAQTVWEAVTSA